MRIRTLPQIIKIIKDTDAQTAITESMLSALIDIGTLPYEKRGNRTVMDYDKLVSIFNSILALDETINIPHIRTIRCAIQENRTRLQELGICEDQIRSAVREDRISTIRVGNRAYIATELFDVPYVQRFTQADIKTEDCRQKKLDNTYVQISEILSSNIGAPKVRRIRK